MPRRKKTPAIVGSLTHQPHRLSKKPTQNKAPPSCPTPPLSIANRSHPRNNQGGASKPGTGDWQPPDGHTTGPGPPRTSDRFFSPGFFCFRGLALPPSLPTILVTDAGNDGSKGSVVRKRGGATSVVGNVDGRAEWACAPAPGQLCIKHDSLPYDT